MTEDERLTVLQYLLNLAFQVAKFVWGLLVLLLLVRIAGRV